MKPVWLPYGPFGAVWRLTDRRTWLVSGKPHVGEGWQAKLCNVWQILQTSPVFGTLEEAKAWAEAQEDAHAMGFIPPPAKTCWERLLDGGAFADQGE